MGCSSLNDRSHRLIATGVCWLLLVSGCWYFMLTRPGIGIRWKQEAPPPEPVSRLKIEGNGRTLAETSHGREYEFVDGLNPPWIKVTAAMQSLDMNCEIGDLSGYLILSPPGNVASRVSQHCVVSESGYHFELVLLENGEIWSWR